MGSGRDEEASESYSSPSEVGPIEEEVGEFRPQSTKSAQIATSDRVEGRSRGEVGKEVMENGRSKENVIHIEKKSALVSLNTVSSPINLLAPTHAFNARKENQVSLEESGKGEVDSLEYSLDNSFVVGTTSNNNGALFDSGPEESMEFSKSPLSFDSACRIIQFAKTKRDRAKLRARLKKRKKREVRDLGLRVELKPSYFAIIAPRNNNFTHANEDAVNTESEDDSISNGTFLPSLSHTDSEVIRCNKRLSVPPFSDVGRKVWNSISRLGVSFGGDERMGIQKIEAMEQRDKQGGKVQREIINVLP